MAKEQSLNTDQFLSPVKKYTEITELDAEIIRELIDKWPKKPAHLDILQLYRRGSVFEQGRKNGIAAYHDYAEFFRDYKSP